MGKGKRKGRLAQVIRVRKLALPYTSYNAQESRPRQHTGVDPVVGVTGETALRA